MILGRLERDGSRVAIFNVTSPSFEYSVEDLKSRVPAAEWARFETWKQEMKHRYPVCADYLDIEWDIDQSWDYQGRAVYLIAYPLCEDEVLEAFQFSWEITDGNLRYAGCRPVYF